MVFQHGTADATYDSGKLQRENVDLRAQVIRLKREHAAREAALRDAYQEHFGMLLSAFGISDKSETLPNGTGDGDENALAINHNLVLLVKRRIDAALANPSPVAEAMLAVVEATMSEWQWIEKTQIAVEDYRATLRGDMDGGAT